MKTNTLLAIVISPISFAVQAEQTLVLNSVFSAPITSSEQDGVLDLVYQALSHRLGIKIEIHNLSNAERVLVNVNDGVVDGDAGRILGINKNYPNMEIVPVPVMKFEMVVFARNVDFRVNGPASIKSYSIGLVRGWRILEQAAGGASSVIEVESPSQLFSMLDKNRVDIVLLEKLEGLHLLTDMGVKGVKILKPNLIDGYFYLYLNKKHNALIPKITSELRKMQQDGSLNRIYDSVMARYAL